MDTEHGQDALAVDAYALASELFAFESLLEAGRTHRVDGALEWCVAAQGRSGGIYRAKIPRKSVFKCAAKRAVIRAVARTALEEFFGESSGGAHSHHVTIEFNCCREVRRRGRSGA